MNRIKICILVAAMALSFQRMYSQDIEIKVVSDSMFFPNEKTLTVSVRNLSNIDVSNIPLELKVWCHPEGYFTLLLYDTLKGVLQADSSRNLTFYSHYPVPYFCTECYLVRVKAELEGDINPSNNEDTITGCLPGDIAIVSLVTPATYECAGEPIYPEVIIENRSTYRTYSTVVMNAIMSVGYGSDDVILTDTLRNFAPDTRFNLIFTSYYIVPPIAYTLTIYVNSVDDYPYNDTLTILRNLPIEENPCTGIANHHASGFALEQNIPNPTKENTQITYHIPKDGEVIFTVHSITGQTLYREKKNSYSGKNEIEFNTANLANGIYYYSMEYNGERSVKRMTINH